MFTIKIMCDTPRITPRMMFCFRLMRNFAFLGASTRSVAALVYVRFACNAPVLWPFETKAGRTIVRPALSIRMSYLSGILESLDDNTTVVRSGLNISYATLTFYYDVLLSYAQLNQLLSNGLSTTL